MRTREQILLTRPVLKWLTDVEHGPLSRSHRCRRDPPALDRGRRAHFGRALVAALNHSPPGSEVDIRLTDDDGKSRIDVEDRGQGIAAADLPPFDRMWRGDRNRARDEDRFGLGLSIAERHATLLGATIEVRSEPGSGSVFLWFSVEMEETQTSARACYGSAGAR